MKKQSDIVFSKLWDARTNNKKAVFPCEFYTQKGILKGVGSFDLKNVSVYISFGKTNKGFDAYIVSFND